MFEVNTILVKPIIMPIVLRSAQTQDREGNIFVLQFLGKIQFYSTFTETIRNNFVQIEYDT